MKKLLKIVLYLFAAIALLLLMVSAGAYFHYERQARQNKLLVLKPSPWLNIGGYRFRDLNKNGKLDIYEDARQPLEKRIEDVLAQMTLEEKAGMMFIAMAGIGPEGALHEKPFWGDMLSFFLPPNPEIVLRRKINHVNAMAAEAVHLTRWTNAMQTLADGSRLGIPMTIASDPRHAFSYNPLATLPTKGFTEWPEPIGFGALGDTAIMRQFADIARREYRAVGLHLALHPMADLATEPRWPRINGTFGEDAERSSQLVYAYIKGFQGDSLGPQSVACMSKHFSGGGPQKDGLDPHFDFGKEQVYPGRQFQYHLLPFKAALAAGTAQMMPYYGIPMDQTHENVGFSFNKKLIAGLLRQELGFDGVVCTDWGLLTDKKLFGITVFHATAWGVEQLSTQERMAKALEAGVDQFGGETCTEELLALVHSGKVSEKRLDESVRRLLRDKFRLGLFDSPFVDEDRLSQQIGQKQDLDLGKLTQGRAMVLLKNEQNLLPLKKGLSLYVENVSKEEASRYGRIVDRPEEADLALIRLQTPFQIQGNNPMARFFHHGDLDFKGREKERILNLLRKVPTIVDIYMDRPAVIPEITQLSAGMLTNFGASDEVLLRVVFGEIHPQGRLPFELPSSMEAVYQQLEDVPYDSKKPLFPFGFGLSYGAKDQDMKQ